MLFPEFCLIAFAIAVTSYYLRHIDKVKKNRADITRS